MGFDIVLDFVRMRNEVKAMIVRNALALKHSIDESRQDMYELARKKGISDPQVIKISQQLDKQIIKFQKITHDIKKIK